MVRIDRESWEVAAGGWSGGSGSPAVEVIEVAVELVETDGRQELAEVAQMVLGELAGRVDRAVWRLGDRRVLGCTCSLGRPRPRGLGAQPRGDVRVSS